MLPIFKEINECVAGKANYVKTLNNFVQNAKQERN